MSLPIAKWYYWFWHDVCHRPEPFTYTMRRHAKEHPLWWIIPPLVALGLGGGYYLLVVHLWGIL